MENRSHRYDINRHKPRHELKYTKYKMFLSINILSIKWWLYILSNTQATFEAQFMTKRSNAEAELKKRYAYKKGCNLLKRYYAMQNLFESY